jgi:hypothetical protein
MAEAAVTLDIPQAADILRDLTAERSFDGVVTLQESGQAGHFLLVQLAGALGGLDAGLVAKLAGDLIAHAVQIAQRNHDRLVVGNIDA